MSRDRSKDGLLTSEFHDKILADDGDYLFLFELVGSFLRDSSVTISAPVLPWLVE